MRYSTRITADREELLAHVSTHPGMWGDDLRESLGWSEGRFWSAVDCPLFDCADPSHPAGYRLTEAGRWALMRLVLSGEPVKRKKKRVSKSVVGFAVEGLLFAGVVR